MEGSQFRSHTLNGNVQHRKDTWGEIRCWRKVITMSDWPYLRFEMLHRGGPYSARRKGDRNSHWNGDWQMSTVLVSCKAWRLAVFPRTDPTPTPLWPPEIAAEPLYSWSFPSIACFAVGARGLEQPAGKQAGGGRPELEQVVPPFTFFVVASDLTPDHYFTKGCTD